MPKNGNSPPTFIVSGLLVPVDRDFDFRHGLAKYRITVISRGRGGAHTNVYSLAVPDVMALWQFIGNRLGPRATDAEVDTFLAYHVRHVALARQIA